jgi:hypothetical protein
MRTCALAYPPHSDHTLNFMRLIFGIGRKALVKKPMYIYTINDLSVVGVVSVVGIVGVVGVGVYHK